MDRRLVSGTAATSTWVLVVVAFLQTVAVQAQRPRSAPRVDSPDLSPEGKLTFRLRAPKADQVRLLGSDLPEIGRGRDLDQTDDGVWQRTLGPVAPGSYRYRFDVDGVAVIDPANPATSESNSHCWSIVHVPGADWMDNRRVPHGAVAQVHYYSESLQRMRRMHVYTPPGYEAGSAKYPVFYLLHGASDSDDSWPTVGRAGFILDNLIADGLAEPMVVVMPAGHTGPFSFGRGGLRMDAFVRDFVNDIKPYVEAAYRVYTDRGHTAIAGLSMGGAHTLNIGIPHLDEYAYLGVFSSGVFGLNRRGPGEDRNEPTWEEANKSQLDDASLKEGLRLVWFATGKDDFLIDTSRATVDLLRKHDFDVTYKESDGGHTWINWREYLREFAQQLFLEKPKPVSSSRSGARKAAD